MPLPSRPQTLIAVALRTALSFAAVSTLLSQTAQAQQATVSLAGLNGKNGFRIDGIAALDHSGYAVSSAGDINGDGLDDLIIGANGTDRNGTNSGSAYIVFGRRGSAAFASSINLSTLNGANGFRLDGVAGGDQCGGVVSKAGDINGDSIGDLVVSSYRTNPNGSNSGSSYVVFGRAGAAGFSSSISLSTLNGNNGFRLDGALEFDRSGYALSTAGDVNGDGIADLVIGAPGTSRSYVVFGRSGVFAATNNLNMLNGSNGFRLDGPVSNLSGTDVSSAGDVNGDGVDDLIIGSPFADFNASNAGSSYVVFGRSGSVAFASSINLDTLDGSNGFRLDGVTASESSGLTVSGAGDVNGDGLSDLIIGAPGSGSSYVVFGRRGSMAFASSINLSALNGSNGFRLYSPAVSDQSGWDVSTAGDFNGDGLGDVIIGAYAASPNGSRSGSSYVVFGRTTGFASSINLNTLDGENGFRLDGVATEDESGRDVSAAGDINGDGYGDIIIGAAGADPDGIPSGSSYVVFGRKTAPMFKDGFE